MERKIKTWITAYKAVKLLKAEGLQITEKTISIWKKEKKIKKSETGLICLEEIRDIILNSPLKNNYNKNKKLPSSTKKQNNKKNHAGIDPKLLKLLRDFEFQKSKGQAEKALIESKKARLAYRKERGSLISKDFITDYITMVFSSHNERTLALPEKLVDSIISIMKVNDESTARPKLIERLKEEISNILESENEEIKQRLKKKSLNY